MKPDWKDAPEWAQWLAQDPCGDWFWYENKPYFGESEWVSSGGRAAWAGASELEFIPEPRP